MIKLPFGTKVSISKDAALPEHITRGEIVGIILQEMPVCGCCYAVNVGELVSDAYPYNVVGVLSVHCDKIE